MGRQVIEHTLDERGDPGTVERRIEIVRVGLPQRLERRPHLRIVVHQHDLEPRVMPRRVGIELAPAERVEPGQERRFAAKRVQFADGLADRRLGDFRRRVAIAVEPRKRKAVERGVGGVEEPLERRFDPPEAFAARARDRYRPRDRLSEPDSQSRGRHPPELGVDVAARDDRRNVGRGREFDLDQIVPLTEQVDDLAVELPSAERRERHAHVGARVGAQPIRVAQSEPAHERHEERSQAAVRVARRPRDRIDRAGDEARPGSRTTPPRAAA